MLADRVFLSRIIISRHHAKTSVDDVMECLKQVSAIDWHTTPPIRQLVDDLATHPYCTNDKGFCHIRSKRFAITHAYIQPNHPAVCKWLAFDIDDPNALFTCYDEGLPPPQIIVKNPTNGHAHYLYRLTTPVGIGGKSSAKALRYLASVQKSLSDALGADIGYSGNLIKNPCHSDHETYITGTQPSYTLAELADYLDLAPLYEKHPQESANDAGYGRNCTLFDDLRGFGYKHTSKDFNDLIRHLTPLADVINNRFDVPLPPNEVRHIIRSIARYCARTNFNASDRAFSELQTARITRRWGDNTDKQKQALILKSEGLSCRKIAEQLNVGKSTVYRWFE